MPVDRLRWITFGHVESDESGSMNDWLAAGGAAQIVYTPLGCDVSPNDLADRPPVAIDDGSCLHIGTHRIRFVATPQVPHGWEAQVVFDEHTQNLFCATCWASRASRRRWSTTGTWWAPPSPLRESSAPRRSPLTRRRRVR